MNGRNTYFQRLRHDGSACMEVYGFQSQFGLKASDIAKLYFDSEFPTEQKFHRVTLSDVRAYERGWGEKVPVRLVSLCGDMKTFTVFF